MMMLLEYGFYLDPPPYTRHDWESASYFWYTFESWSMAKKINDDWRFTKAILKADSWTSLKTALRSRNNLAGAFHQMRSLQKQLARSEECEECSFSQRFRRIFGEIAESMNEIERCTGYRFDNGMDMCNSPCSEKRIYHTK